MVVMNFPLRDNIPIVIDRKLAVVMIVVDHVRVLIAIDLSDTVLVVMSENSAVCGQNQRGRTE